MKRTKLFLSIFVWLFSMVGAMAQHPVLNVDKGVEEFAIPKLGRYSEVMSLG